MGTDNLYKAFFDHATDAIYCHELPGPFIQVNPAACRMLGFEKAELLRMRPEDISVFRAARLETHLKSISEKGYASWHSKHIRKDGSLVDVEVRATLLEHEGRPTLLAIARGSEAWTDLNSNGVRDDSEPFTDTGLDPSRPGWNTTAHGYGGGKYNINAAAYNAVSAAQTGTTIALPLFRSNHTGWRLYTGISAMNAGTAPASISIEVTDSEGNVLAGRAGMQVTGVGAGETALFWPGSFATDGNWAIVGKAYGSATITSDQPLAVIVNDTSLIGSADSSTYNGINATVQ